MSKTIFEKVTEFHEKFKLAYPYDYPSILVDAEQEFRITCLREELKEYEDAVDDEDMAEQFDALIDLVYFALGTAHRMGLPFDVGFDRVHAANMAKSQEPGKQRRGHLMEVTKPDDWAAPVLDDLCFPDDVDTLAQTNLTNLHGLICIDGADATGKTTLANDIAELTGGEVIHLTWTPELATNMNYYRMNAIRYAKALATTKVVILERPWLCHGIYSDVYRNGNYSQDEVRHWRTEVEQSQCCNIIAQPWDKEEWLKQYARCCVERDELHGANLEKMGRVFEAFDVRINELLASLQSGNEVKDKCFNYQNYLTKEARQIWLMRHVIPTLSKKGNV